MWMRHVAFLAVVFSLGCAGSKIAPVSGVVKLDGEPLANASVSFQPLSMEGNVNPGPGSMARTDDNGAFTLRVVGEDVAGAYVGKHRVEISAYLRENGEPGKERGERMRNLVPPQFNKKSTLTFMVPPGGTKEANFDLESK
jgi:hypothetical protein